jgi:hypothetical protein
LISFDLLWSPLISFDHLWYPLISFDIHWSSLIIFDILWYPLIFFDHLSIYPGGMHCIPSGLWIGITTSPFFMNEVSFDRSPCKTSVPCAVGSWGTSVILILWVENGRKSWFST